MSRAVWILWVAVHAHGATHLMQSHIYATAAQCERAAAFLNSTAPELGTFACFRKELETPYAY